MMLHSCQNCWFNGLQYGALGLAVGYCSKHRMILNAAEATTCGLHVRKDLPLQRAMQVSSAHAARYSDAVIVNIYGGKETERETSSDSKDLDSLRSDPVGDIVADYGTLDSTIESLAQLKTLSGARAEVAMTSLARGYVNNCVSRDGSWTSGLHLYWWTKKRLAEIPEISVKDIRTTGGIQLSRQVDLTAWSVVMLRLTFIDDVVQHAAAENEPVGQVKGLLQQAAASVPTFNLRNLTRWMRAEALPSLDKMLPWERYVELSRQLHKQSRV
jgi:hypothetical protein